MDTANWRRVLRSALSRSPELDAALRRLRRSDEVAALQGQVRVLEAKLAAAQAPPADGVTTLRVPPSVAPFLTDNPPGHFYSPVPDLDEIAARADWLFGPRPLAGIELRANAQLALFRTLARLVREMPFEPVPGTRTRYGTENTNYGIGDASMLAAFLCHLRPRRYLEVGSGFTTALACDVNETHLGGSMAITAIEPYPAMMRSLLRPADEIEVIGAPVQSVPLELFAALEENDILFIDCSHVLKTGSDAHFLYTEVLPLLAPGVYVHIHDIFWPFEYLRNWIESGRAWNECYLLQAFLAFNPTYEIVLWNHYLYCEHEPVMAAELPAMLENPGGAIWLRRAATAS
jgi:hypothetical protein